jgi:NAD+ synthase
MSTRRPFSKDIILLDNIESVVNEITCKLQVDVLQNLRRNGAVIGLSGGIDSSVCMALTARALGPEKVVGIMIPEKDSNQESEQLARMLADKFGVSTIKENITPALTGFRCYERRDEAVKKLFPEYNPEAHKMKIGIKQSGLFTSLPPMFSITIVNTDGSENEQLLPVGEYLKIVAASNFKQRARMSILILSRGITSLCSYWNTK